jgi:hypothetical protein
LLTSDDKKLLGVVIVIELVVSPTVNVTLSIIEFIRKKEMKRLNIKILKLEKERKGS